MQIAKSVAQMQTICRELRTQGVVLGFVPTMGALHKGHLSIVQRATAECQTVVASIFVNPLQFAPGEDFAKYPRTFEQDSRQLEAEGVTVLFAPDAKEMYPEGAVTTITVPGIGDRLDGASRPGHFTGVATVVAKLLQIVAPHRAYFGQKDAAQLAVLRQMVQDLNFDLELVSCAIVRDADGLALSSRNQYLSGPERQQALVLHRALAQIEQSIINGERQSPTLLQIGKNTLDAAEGVQVDYLAIVDPRSLLPVASAEKGALVAVAAYVGRTRLIDNFLVT
ncbi:pantoate--beta-alanine ligase [Tunturiibacter gelidoferens]|uniref:Pantothenate synthetase n=1 Tax=Tunturiibacter gelidiferens TaxID=3069689 RepID=A0A9X0QB88_9BACT|nr:pantoate--beta-alanine ligase [Edaphobacter lichenicola]MBB5327192.1 pantoate--beta-alanine ligase [Edaphobacter lichenicola]